MYEGLRSARPGARCLYATLALLLVVVAPSGAAAQWGGAVRAQMGLGGDELASVQYSDGSQSDLKLGTYFSFTAGPVFEAWSSGSSSVEFQGMVGWAGWSTGPENSEDRLRLNRFPVEVLAFYGHRIPARDILLRIGGGLTHHLAGGVSGSGSLDGLEIDLDNALGATGEVAAVFGILPAGLRYTNMSVTAAGASAPLNGSTVALSVGLTTPR